VIRPMTSSVSALSGIVANGHQAIHFVSSAPSKIPYGGFSPVKCGAPHFTGYVAKIKMWRRGPEGPFLLGFSVFYATFYFDHRHHQCCQFGFFLETRPVCSNPYFTILECFRATLTHRWLRSGRHF